MLCITLSTLHPRTNHILLFTLRNRHMNMLHFLILNHNINSSGSLYKPEHSLHNYECLRIIFLSIRHSG